MEFQKNTPIMIVDEIEPCLPLWTEILGFQKTVEVPHEDRLGFVILTSGSVQIMLQSRASVLADLTNPELAPELESGTIVQYLDIDSMDQLLPRLDPASVVMAERTTWYGAREIFIRAPGGFICGFAEHHPPNDQG